MEKPCHDVSYTAWKNPINLTISSTEDHSTQMLDNKKERPRKKKHCQMQTQFVKTSEFSNDADDQITISRK